jgi:sugar O-acyltransferase (sialic acid O-acetyltransferase NeuD family)
MTSYASGATTALAAQQLLIVGAGGHGKEVISYVRDLAPSGTDLPLAGLIDENKPPGPFSGSVILGGFGALELLLREHPRTDFRFITAVGDNPVRRELVAKICRLGASNLAPWTLRHPRAVMGDEVEIGHGTCLAPGSIVTTHVKIGEHCILNLNASVSHDTIVGSFANINPGAVISGNVVIGEGCYIGAGATVIDKVSIGEWTVIGAGAVVVDDIPPCVTAVGVPARVIKVHAAPNRLESLARRR